MITNLLIFFAIPLAIVVSSIALEKILKNPFLVAGLIFSFLLVGVLAFFEPIYLIAVVVYTVLAYISAVLYRMFCRYQNINTTTSSTIIENKIIDDSNENIRCRKYY